MKIKRSLICALAAIVLLAAGTTVRAQDITGSIAGTVVDAKGAAVSGAKVTVTNTDKNQEVATMTTGGQGEYIFPALLVGHYTVTVEINGFKKTEKSNISLNVHDKLEENFNLQVGSLTESVTITADAMHVETESATQAGLISGTEVHELPLTTRNFAQLTQLMPGVSNSSAVDTMYIGTTLPGGTTATIPFYINGERNSSTYWTIDGADNIDRGSDLTLLNYPSVDAIEEFKVLRGNYDPEYGRSGGAQVTVVTKSGTSAFHGSLYEFFRNDVLQANTFFNNLASVKRPPLRYNDFGFTIGGPLYIPHVYNEKKEKTYFFYSQEVRRVITYATVTAQVPTAAMKSGQFSAPVCTAFNAAGTCTATGTTISSIDPVAAAYIKDIWNAIPTPNSTGTALIVPLRNQFNANQQLVRIDHTFSPKVSIFGRFMHDSIPTIEPGGLFTGAALPGVSTTSTNSPGYNLVFHVVTTISPNLLNDGGFQYSQGAILSDPIGTDASALSPDIKPALPFGVSLGRIPSLSLTGISGIAGFGPYRDYNRNYNYFDNQTWIHGRHTFKFGISANHYEKTENAGGNNVGSYSILTTGQTGTVGGVTLNGNNFEESWANFLLGRVSSFTQASLDVTPDIFSNQIEFYGQDEWRIRPNLTITFGLRYSLFRQPYDDKHLLTNFDPSLYDPAKAPTIDGAGNICTVAPCAAGGTGAAPNPNFNPLNGIIINNSAGLTFALPLGSGTATAPFGEKTANEDNSNVGPRIGFAWDPWNNGKTSIRGGYGIFYDSSLFGIIEQNIFANPPFVQSISISNTTLANPGGGTVSVSKTPVSPHATMFPSSTPYVQQISLDVQRQLGTSWIVDVGYVGNHGTHLLGIEDLNMPLPGAYVAAGLSTVTSSGNIVPGSGGAQNENLLNIIRPFRGYGPISAIESRFNSNYNALQSELQKRWGSSILKLDYTYSKALTDNQTDRSSAPQNLYDILSEYGPLQGDRTHIFSADYVYDLPWLKSQQGIAGHVLGGWQISGIISAATGLPLTILSSQSFDPAGQGVKLSASPASYRPDMIGNPNTGAPHGYTQWFNTAVFVNVPATQARPGNETRGTVRGPGYQRWDFALAKNFRITERTGLDFRAEAINVWNHTNFQGVDTTLGDASGINTFGHITSTRDPRVLQLGLKLHF